MKRFGARLICLCVVVFVSVVMSPAAVAFPPGSDLFETDPQATQFQFTNEFAIPAGFFDPGSSPFSGSVNFGGEPVNTFAGKDTGDADTIVRRPNGANLLPPFPVNDTVPIELVALNLVSVQPITVTVSGQQQLWDVRATLSPTRPSAGQMTVRQTANEGGLFSSQLQVIPMFTFTRTSDGTQRTLDLGAQPLPAHAFNALFLQTTNAPWRAGCIAPALAVAGLNDGFCPGLTTTGQKQVTLHQAQIVRHGTYPAQPRLEHFKCYDVRRLGRRFKQRTVSLVDQFGSEAAQVVKPRDLCNPVQKNNEPFQNRADHLKCYTIRTPAFRQRQAFVRNQFGSDVLTVIKPDRLCLPSVKQFPRKRRPPAFVPSDLLDHFKCYRVTSANKFARRKVQLKDQFHRESPNVLKPVQLCAPVQKNNFPVRHPVRHLVCYQIKGKKRFRPRVVRVRNQFGLETLAAVKPRRLCVPSVKLLG